MPPTCYAPHMRGDGIVSLDQWKDLYGLAAKIYDLAPWRLMDETQIFAVREPHCGATGFVSVMGALGEHHAIAVYRDAEGLYGFAELESNTDRQRTRELMFETPQLQLSFGNRGELTKPDKAIIDSLGLKPKRGAVPVFRSYLPGYFPWSINAEEAGMLQCALEQVIELVPRCAAGPLRFAEEVEGPYLLRRKNGERWEDDRITVAPPHLEVRTQVPSDLLAAVRRGRRVDQLVEVDFFMTPSAIGTKNERPRCAYALLVVDGGIGMILGMQLETAEPNLQAMWGRVGARFLEVLSKHGTLPARVAVSDPRVAGFLNPVANHLPIELVHAARLRNLDDAKRALLQQMGG